MPRPFKLNDLEKITAVVDIYKKLEKPTLTAYCRLLKVTPNTLYAAMSREDDIATILIEGWSHLLEKWEDQLWSKQYVPAMFYLKTIKRFGYRWNDKEGELEAEQLSNKISNITFNIVDKTNKLTEVTEITDATEQSTSELPPSKN